MLPPPTAILFAQPESLHNKDNSAEFHSTLLILPAAIYGSNPSTSSEDSIQRPTEPPIYVKLLEEDDDWRASGILHDFNNQLAIILSHCSIALTKLPMESNARSNLERSIRATKRAADLSSQLQVGRAAQDDVFETINYNELVQETVGDLEPQLVAHAELRQQYTHERLAVSANRMLLQRALLNILSNAAEAMYRRNGTITITTERLVITHSEYAKVPRSLPLGTYALCEVCDDGHGMDQDTLDRIFEPYFSTKAIGSGLGLTMALHIIQLHHGVIYIRSKAQSGTIFQILLPITENKEVIVPNER